MCIRDRPQTGKNYELGLKGEHLDGKLNTCLLYTSIEPDASGALSAARLRALLLEAGAAP